jgi:hypothetical protein
VVVSLSAWGGSGPWKGRRGFDSLVQAACGIAECYGHTGDDGWRPGALPLQALDHATGYGMAAAALALLAERVRSGVGGAARLSLARTGEELFRFPAVDGPDQLGGPGHLGQPGASGQPANPLSEPAFRMMDSAYGALRHVGPPILVDGVQLGYSKGPVRYGSSPLRWA